VRAMQFVAGMFACFTFALWCLNTFWYDVHIVGPRMFTYCIRPGIGVVLETKANVNARKNFEFGFSPIMDYSIWWSLPSFEYDDGNEMLGPFGTFPNPYRSPSYSFFIPHWLTNLVAWSLFLILWRKARKHPKGHCQSCGYDLTGNESGACPECNAESVVQGKEPSHANASRKT